MIDFTCECSTDESFHCTPEDEQSREDQTMPAAGFPWLQNFEAEQDGRSCPPASSGSTDHGAVSPSYQTANGLAMKEKAGHNKPIAFPCRASILIIEESRLPLGFSFQYESILLEHPPSIASVSIPADRD